MKKPRTQKEVIELISSGFKLYSSYPYSGCKFTCRVEKEKKFYNVIEVTFKALLANKSIGNATAKTNREYEYFLMK